MPVTRPDPCASHTLWLAHSPVPSADGRLVYVVCRCDRWRVVAAAAWQQELTRRQEAARHAQAARARAQALAAQPPVMGLGDTA